jgi:hypothetical protein
MLILEEVPVTWQPVTPPPEVAAFAEEGLRRSRAIDCFDFVPTDYPTVYAVLRSLPRGSFCEWGSGLGIVTGIAEMLGFQACGIEIHAELAAASRRLLHDFGLRATIATGNYLQMAPQADLHFVYCWPGETPRVEAHFLAVTAPSARLLYCNGAADIRCRRKASA